MTDLWSWRLDRSQAGVSTETWSWSEAMLPSLAFPAWTVGATLSSAGQENSFHRAAHKAVGGESPQFTNKKVGGAVGGAVL